MTRLTTEPRLPAIGTPDYDKYLANAIAKEFRDTNSQVNGITEGRITPVTNATTAVPTTGTYTIGDFVRNSTPSELGAAASKYIIYGWLCTDDDPLTFVQCRFLTGN